MLKNIEAFFEVQSKWQEEYHFLREVLLKTNLQEEFKWGKPCYTYKGRNIVLMHGFKDYCALLFHKGVLLRDTANILVQQTENVQAARQIRFTEVSEIKNLENIIQSYVYAAIEVEKDGLNVPMKTTSEFEMVTELQEAFEENPALKEAFTALTPGRQRGYLLHFSKAKQSITRKSRIEKSVSDILEGKGLNDYKR